MEEYVCEKLGLRPARISTQILQRDRHAEYLTSLAIVASSLERFALEIRHLQRTEVGEVEEPFSRGQKGSSAMPHKRNPVGCEQICGLARVVRTNAIAGLEDVALWHERDISHSSVERVVIPDSTILVDYIIDRFTNIIRGLGVFPRRMKENLERTRGLIFSQRVLLALVKKGVSREVAYSLVQRNAFEVCAGKGDFRELLLQDEEVRRYLNEEEITACFDLEYLVRYRGRVIEKVIGE